MPPAKPQQNHPGTADLNNPLYYLENMETVLGWVQSHHGDLLTAEELDRLASFHTLSLPARALLTRMVMRTGDIFRSDKLKYPELGAPEQQALAELTDTGWLDTDPLLSLDELFRLFTLGELRPALGPLLKAAGEPANLPKGRMRDALLPQFPDSHTVADWLGQHARPVVRLKTMALFDRVRLMFFGNLRQSWSDFVLVELGHQQYEPVTFYTGFPGVPASFRGRPVPCHTSAGSGSMKGYLPARYGAKCPVLRRTPDGPAAGTGCCWNWAARRSVRVSGSWPPRPSPAVATGKRG